MLWAINPGWGVCVGGGFAGTRKEMVRHPRPSGGQGQHFPHHFSSAWPFLTFIPGWCFILALWTSLCFEHFGEKLWVPLKRHRCQRQKRAGAANSPRPSFYREKPGAETIFFTPLPQPLDVVTAATSERPSRGSPGLCSFSQQNVPVNLKTLLLFKCITLNLLWQIGNLLWYF